MLETILSFFREPCSFWFNRWGRRDWSHCCAAHDAGYDDAELAYDRAFFRLMRDEELRDCVNRVLPGMGSAMFFGLRVFNFVTLTTA